MLKGNSGQPLITVDADPSQLDEILDALNMDSFIYDAYVMDRYRYPIVIEIEMRFVDAAFAILDDLGIPSNWLGMERS